MKILLHTIVFAFVAALLSVAPSALAQEDHSGHDMGNMSAEQIQELRDVVPSLADRTDEEIRFMMTIMPLNYERYVSDENQRGPVGVVVAVHGFGEEGDEIFAQSLVDVSKNWPTSVGFGMAMMTSAQFQTAVDNLTAAGAETIVVVPATQTEHDTGIRQYKYIFGAREEPSYTTVPQVETDAEIIVTPPVSQHPIISELLLDHAREISTNEVNEEVIILGHRPSGDEDNAKELEEMATHAVWMKENSYFADVHRINLQDDALKAIREANVAKLRDMAQTAIDGGKDVIVVGYLLGSAGIQPKIEKDLAGIPVKFNDKGMSAHPLFAKWVETMVRDALGES